MSRRTLSVKSRVLAVGSPKVMTWRERLTSAGRLDQPAQLAPTVAPQRGVFREREAPSKAGWSAQQPGLHELKQAVEILRVVRPRARHHEPPTWAQEKRPDLRQRS
jgi:hypothetical protein